MSEAIEYHELEGMSLRAHFAAKAMQGWLASFDGHSSFPKPAIQAEMAAHFCSMADALIAELAKPTEAP